MFFKRLSLFLLLFGITFLLDLAAERVDESNPCTRVMLRSFFPESFVAGTLQKFDIPEEKWDAITTELAEKNHSVVSMIEQKVEGRVPNPLQDPELRDEAVKLFRDTLLEIFSGVLVKHGISDKEQILQMFNDLQMQKAKQFATCLLES